MIHIQKQFTFLHLHTCSIETHPVMWTVDDILDACHKFLIKIGLKASIYNSLTRKKTSKPLLNKRNQTKTDQLVILLHLRFRSTRFKARSSVVTTQSPLQWPPFARLETTWKSNVVIRRLEAENQLNCSSQITGMLTSRFVAITLSTYNLFTSEFRQDNSCRRANVHKTHFSA